MPQTTGLLLYTVLIKGGNSNYIIIMWKERIVCEVENNCIIVEAYGIILVES